jgi:hypothetical protein
MSSVRVSYNTNGKARGHLFLYFVFPLILLYTVQDFQSSANVGARDAERGSVHLTLAIILAVLGLYYVYTATRHGIKRHPVVEALWLITWWVAVVNLVQHVNTWSVAVHCGLSVLWILAYHFFSNYLQCHPSAWRHIQVFVVIMFGFYVFSALYAASILRMTYSRIVVVNLAYNVLVFLPWLELLSAKWMRGLGIGLVFCVVLVSMKRGAIIVLPIMLSTSLAVKSIIRRRGGSAFLRNTIMLVLLLIGVLAVDQWTGGYLSERFSPESLASGSGRTQLYSYAIEDISQRSLWNMLIGLGSGSSIRMLGTGVHNEWLEFFFSFGVIGVTMYGLFFCSLAWRLLQLIRVASPHASAYAMAIAYMLVVGMYGGIYFMHSTLYVMALLGAVEGLAVRDRRTAQAYHT